MIFKDGKTFSAYVRSKLHSGYIAPWAVAISPRHRKCPKRDCTKQKVNNESSKRDTYELYDKFFHLEQMRNKLKVTTPTRLELAIF